MIIKIKKEYIKLAIIYTLFAVFICILVYILGYISGMSNANAFYGEYLKNCICL